MLNDVWRDIITLSGFVLTVVGLIYAIAQIRKTKSAATAAEETAKATLKEMQKNFRKYATVFAHRYVNEVKVYLHNENPDWQKAAMRLGDLADIMVQIVIFDQIERPVVAELRKWADTFRRIAIGELKRYAITRWEEFFGDVQSRIDGLIRPFDQEGKENTHDFE